MITNVEREVDKGDEETLIVRVELQFAKRNRLSISKLPGWHFSLFCFKKFIKQTIKSLQAI